jgi:hypothetical protein
MSDSAERLLGELHGKMDLVLDRLDKINGTIGRHSDWIAAHEQKHALQQGESRVKGGIWKACYEIGKLAGAALFGGFVSKKLWQ